MHVYLVSHAFTFKFFVSFNGVNVCLLVEEVPKIARCDAEHNKLLLDVL